MNYNDWDIVNSNVLYKRDDFQDKFEEMKKKQEEMLSKSNEQMNKSNTSDVPTLDTSSNNNFDAEVQKAQEQFQQQADQVEKDTFKSFEEQRKKNEEEFQKTAEKGVKTGIIMTVIFSIIFFSALGFIIYLYFYRRRKNNERKQKVNARLNAAGIDKDDFIPPATTSYKSYVNGGAANITIDMQNLQNLQNVQNIQVAQDGQVPVSIPMPMPMPTQVPQPNASGAATFNYAAGPSNY